MGSETLSQNEIDALLGGSGASEPAVVQAPTPTATEAQLYDFRRPNRISKDKLRGLTAMYERLAKSLEGWLLGRVRGSIRLTLQSIEHYSFGEFILSLPTPCASFTFDIGESGGQQGVIDFGGELAFFLVDRLFGGSGEAKPLPRALTPMERLAVRGVAERSMNQLVEVWSDHVELQCALNGFESVPDILRAANREDPVLVANIEVTAAGTSSLLLICLPLSALERFFAGATERRPTFVGSSRDQAATREITESSLRATKVSLAARLPEFRLSLGELRSLTTGSVLATGIPRNSLLNVFVGAQQRFQATPGRVGSSLAVRLLDRASAPPDEASPTTRK
jgi:flagellar motor switch protein FliM